MTKVTRSALAVSAAVCLPLLAVPAASEPGSEDDAAPFEVPTRTIASVQEGPIAAPVEAVLYEPGRVLVQVTSQAMPFTLLERAWRGEGWSGNPTPRSGLPSLDAELALVGVTDIARTYVETADVDFGRDLGLDRWYSATVDAGTDVEALARRLVALDVVEDAQPDWHAFPAQVPNDPLHAQHWGHRNTAQMLSYCWGCGGHPNGSPVGTVGFDCSAETAWDAPQGYGSSSVVIAIIDSGVDVGHPDLAQVAGYDYGSNDSNPDDNASGAGHGTACAGVAAAIANNGLGTAGIAGGSQVMPLKVASSSGGISFSAVANAIIHAADNGADIASLSLGAQISNDSGTSSAIQYAHSSGVTLLAATANSNLSSIDFPANHSLVIGVGAASPCGERKRSSSSSSDVNPGVATDPNGYTCDGERWWGSNYGTNSQDAAGAVDVIAPTILPTTDIQGAGGYDSGNYSLWFNGTSCSTPYAAGVCALILSANPSFTPTQVRDRLVTTCDDVTSVESGTGWDRYTGYGMVNAAAAVNAGPPPVQSYTQIPYATGFESGSLDAFWSTMTGPEGRIQVTTANGPYAGSRHLTMDDSVSGGAFTQNEAWLHLDLAGESQVDLSFQWKEFGDETHAQDGVYFSSNGGASFVKVHDLNGGSTTNQTWSAISLDLDSLAAGAGLALTSTFVVKLQQYDNYPIASDGFAFDEVSVQPGSTGGGGGNYATLPYTTGFEAGALDANWVTTEGVEGRIQVTTSNGPSAGSWHLTMDDAVDGGSFSQNEAWMRLDLAGESQVALSFRWKEFGDETHAQDGVYFSDDGGAGFVKVYDLNGGSFTNDTWQSVDLDLDALAASAGLSLSSTFVVKFQQYDNYGITLDGFAFDEVSVTAGGGGPSGYATLPYSTGFDSGSLDTYWVTTEGTEGRVQVTTSNGPYAGSHHLTMDDTVNGSAYSLNEAWLRLDLSGESQVSLSFRWKEFGDETHSQDGVYFSDDAGSSFVKVYDLNGSSFSNNTWQLVSLDLDSLAAGAGLALSSTFVVKIQQYDNYAIATDGFAIDEVSVD